MPDSKLCEVYSAADIQEAYALQAVMEESGIEARVVGEHLQNAVGDLPAIAIAPRIWVRSEDFDRARKIILDHETRRQSVERSATEWKCSGCGEPNEATFAICWNCQTARGE